MKFNVDLAFSQQIGIYYREKKWADMIAEQIIEHYKENDALKRVVESALEKTIYLKDGSVIRFVLASESRKGCKFSKVFLQKGIDEELRDRMIGVSLFSIPLISEINDDLTFGKVY